MTTGLSLPSVKNNLKKKEANQNGKKISSFLADHRRQSQSYDQSARLIDTTAINTDMYLQRTAIPQKAKNAQPYFVGATNVIGSPRSPSHDNSMATLHGINAQETTQEQKAIERTPSFNSVSIMAANLKRNDELDSDIQKVNEALANFDVGGLEQALRPPIKKRKMERGSSLIPSI